MWVCVLHTRDRPAAAGAARLPMHLLQIVVMMTMVRVASTFGAPSQPPGKEVLADSAAALLGGKHRLLLAHTLQHRNK